jgi:methionyl-tRNA formyltransferase
MRVVFLGTGAIGVPSLRALAASELCQVEAVVTQPDRPAGRDLKLRPSPVKVAAQELGRPILQPAKIRAPEALAQLIPFRPDVIVVAAYGQILPTAVLSLPPLGCVNIHASLLPRHRGAAPVQAAILAGDGETGITIMQMDEGLDTGDMLLKVTTPIAPDETAGSLHDRLALLAPAPLLDCLERLTRGTATPERQDPAQATYAPKLDRSDGEIHWNRSALEIERRIRAMTPWPGAFTVMPLRNAGVMLKIHRAEVFEGAVGEAGTILAADDEGIIVAAGEEGMLLKEVQIAGGKRLSTADFLHGHPMTPGTRLGEFR